MNFYFVSFFKTLMHCAVLIIVFVGLLGGAVENAGKTLIEQYKLGEITSDFRNPIQHC
jgi:hypothetical protein